MVLKLKSFNRSMSPSVETKLTSLKCTVQILVLLRETKSPEKRNKAPRTPSSSANHTILCQSSFNNTVKAHRDKLILKLSMAQV
jgi:hypothetical protein